ncbi:hypothetical protein HOK51_09835 [Candidatus Woesearchaeota archaeon]|jgi:hypothetical protein|nr:hypothetical protein [Candidatus Woesearchaeota archaeon]MBT6520124.1 hypothetical protein [Candidatus Woesearchaeota archaeon]MBT7366729.1 hypothetical protein [Candidatus Woesearchaeota archaeon]
MTNQNNIPGEKLEKILALAELFQLQDKHKPVFDESSNTFTSEEVIERAKDKGIRANYVKQALAKYDVPGEDSLNLITKLGGTPSIKRIVHDYGDKLFPLIQSSFPTENFEIEYVELRGGRSHDRIYQLDLFRVERKKWFKTKKNRTLVFNVCSFYGIVLADDKRRVKGNNTKPNTLVESFDPVILNACSSYLLKLKNKWESHTVEYHLLEL